MQYLEGLDTKTLYRTEFESHADTLCAVSAYRKMNGT